MPVCIRKLAFVTGAHSIIYAKLYIQNIQASQSLDVTLIRLIYLYAKFYLCHLSEAQSATLSNMLT